MPREKLDKLQISGTPKANTTLGPRTTRSKKVFSPWEIYDVTQANPLFNLDALIEAKAQRDSLQPDGPLDEDEVGIQASDSNSTPDAMAQPSSPHFRPVQQDMSPQPSNLTPHPLSLDSVEVGEGSSYPSRLDSFEEVEDGSKSKEHRRKRRNAASHAARAKKRQNPDFNRIQPRQSIRARYEEPKDTVTVPMSIDTCKASSTGFTGPRDVKTSQAARPFSYFVGEGSLGFTHRVWNGSSPMLLVDNNRRLVGVLAGHPHDENWPATVREATEALEIARQECSSIEKTAGRRGAFSTLRCGVSHGGGQKKPGNLQNSEQDRAILTKLNSLGCFTRVSSFSSSVMATRAPKLFQDYATKMGKLYSHDSTLKRPFPGSIQSAATYNLGPQTVCNPHHDGGNYACGLCSITPYGLFDYNKGGHLVLWECRLVIDFPPGSTILIPSALITHSNTAIQPHETRYSFAQYTAGALFRWVENDFQKASTYRNSLSPEERKKAEEQDANRWRENLSLLPIVPAKKIPSSASS